LWGPVRSTTKKNSYIMVVRDAFTKFATAVAIPGKEAMHVAPALLSHLYTFGIPMQLVTDQGREYCNELEKHLWTALKIRHNLTTPYHPACNNAVETFNKILKFTCKSCQSYYHCILFLLSSIKQTTKIQKDPQALHRDSIGGRGGIDAGLGGIPGAIALRLQQGGIILNKGYTIRGNVRVRPKSAIVGRSQISRGRDRGEKRFCRISSGRK
jgi:transposase InsO family protein